MRHPSFLGAALAGAVGAAASLAAGASAAEPVPRADVEAALPHLAREAVALVASGAVPGLGIVVAHGDEVVFLEGFGLRAAGRPETVGADTVFQLASMSKPISATVVAALVGDGIVDWEDRVADLEPGFGLHDPFPSAEATLRDLFNHRSGLPGTSGDDLEDIGFGRETILARLRLIPPSSSFRAGYAYSNAGLSAAGFAAARAAGGDWADVAQTRLFDRLGMATASFRHDDFAARDDAAALHVRVEGDWTAKLLRDADPQAPAGGASASARDLGAWLRFVIAGGVFDGEPVAAADALAAAHEPLFHRGPNPVGGGESFYGLGWTVGFGRHGLVWGHAGAFSVGARTVVTIYPEAGLGIVVLANAFPTGAPEALSDAFADRVFDGAVAQDYLTAWDGIYSGLFGPAIAAAEAAYAAPPVPATPSLPAAAYAGDYANDYVGEASVAEETGGLALVVGPDGARNYPLTHFDRDIFLYYPDPEMPTLPSALRFAVGPDGRATAMTAESLDSNGLGTLVRRP